MNLFKKTKEKRYLGPVGAVYAAEDVQAEELGRVVQKARGIDGANRIRNGTGRGMQGAMRGARGTKRRARGTKCRARGTGRKVQGAGRGARSAGRKARSTGPRMRGHRARGIKREMSSC